MSDQNVAVENKMHIQTLINPDPDFLESQEKPSIQEIIENHIAFNSNEFDHYYKGSALLNVIKNIVYGKGDPTDKYFDIKYEIDKEIEKKAKFIAENHQVDNYAKSAYNEIMNQII